MIERLFRGDARDQQRTAHDDFDPVAEGRELQLEPGVALALWERARADPSCIVDEQRTRARFLDAARRVARTPGRGSCVPGRMSLVQAAAAGFAHPMLDPSVPGRDTEVAASERRWRASGQLPRETAPTPALWQVAEQRTAVVYRRAQGSASGDVDDRSVGQALAEAGRGNRLPDDLRHDMERQLGVGLTGVRIHTDPLASSAARTLRAEAFTVGEDIYFAEGAFAPDTVAGRTLIVHELVHVAQAQQGRTAASSSGLDVSDPADPLEQEADQIAAEVVATPRRAHAAPRPVAARPATARVYRQPARDTDHAAPSDGKDARPPAPVASGPMSVIVDDLSSSLTATDGIARAAEIYAAEKAAATNLTGSVIPAYLKARDALQVDAVVSLGGQLIGGFSFLHGAKAALDELLKSQRHETSAAADVTAELARAALLHDVEDFAPQLAQLDAAIADALTPHTFRGREVAGKRITLNLAATARAERTAALCGEVQRTAAMIQLVQELTQSVLRDRKGLDRDRLDAARARVVPWASRPIDLAFLRLALGGLWNVLDITADGSLTSRPSDLLGSATAQAEHTGWLGDVGQFDLDEACRELRIGTRDNAEVVIRRLYTADPETRAKLLEQVQQRGMLDALCAKVGWADIKDLHDSLAAGHGELKTELQHHFLGKHGFGPAVGQEWESHDSSLHSLIGRMGGFGDVVNFALNVGTFGFHASYGKALDNYSEGKTSAAEASRAQLGAVVRTAVTAIISSLTGGFADKLIRGGAATVSVTRAMAAGAAGGSVGAVSALAASDTYGVATGEQAGFSSLEDYVKAVLLGGAVGAGMGGGFQALSKWLRGRGARVLPGEPGGQSELTDPASEAFAADHPELASAASQAGVSPGSLSAPQRELLVTANQAIAAGDIHGAIKQFDQLIASGVPKAAAHKLEDALAHAAGKTSPAVYRDPHATLPNGARVNPSAYGGVKYYGTGDIEPSVAFERGLPARGGNTNLISHVHQGADTSMRGTTLQIFEPRGRADLGQQGAGVWAGDGGFVYKIDGVPSWDLNVELEGRVPRADGGFYGNPMFGEHEHSILANVPRERIVEAIPISERNGRLVPGPPIPNPNYKPIQ